MSTEGSVATQLAQLVPTFDPGTDNVEVWRQKVLLLVKAWPGKLVEFATRILLNTKGSAFQKLELRQAEVLTGTKEGIQKIIEIVTGQFGQVDLEKKYDVVDRALYKRSQKADETSDSYLTSASYLARADVAWTEIDVKRLRGKVRTPRNYHTGNCIGGIEDNLVCWTLKAFW